MNSPFLASSHDDIDIVLLEDNATIRANMLCLLESEGWYVQAFQNPHLCLSALFEMPDSQLPRIILSDYNLGAGVMDGIAFTATLKLSARHQHIPILMVSAEVSPTLHAHAKQHGIVAWVDKMNLHKELLIAIQRFILP
ncbi:MAG: response regulator [Ignavibacteria bacterium]|nr:response regulator [Ignavibacteria bacterium]